MLSQLLDLARPFLFTLEPEMAHEATLRSLEAGVYPRASSGGDARLVQTLFGLTFPNPVGIAAGFDKDARVPDAVLGLGCGFAECGTITPLPQSGNPRPRVFRLIARRALINRLGFNNGGHAAALDRLRRRAHGVGASPTTVAANGIVGINIGANKDAHDRVADYVAGIDTFYDVASYLAINISSPNTPGLRDLQAPAVLDALLSRVMAARQRHIQAGKPTVPILVKIAPDIAEDDIRPIVARLTAHGVDGIMVSNTTLARPGLGRDPAAGEAGGLSGAPLFHRSTVMLARVRIETGGRVPLVGIGGITSPETALAKVEAGASLVQIYTGLIYEGAGLIGRVRQLLGAAVTRARLPSITGIVGNRASEWAAKPLDG